MTYSISQKFIHYFLYRIVLLSFFGLGLFLFSTVVLAASSVTAAIAPADIANEGLRRQEQTQNKALQSLEQENSVLTPAPSVAKDLSLSSEAQCFDIDEVEVSSAETFSWIEEEITQAFTGCIGINNIKQILGHINDSLLEKGFITSKLSLPEQNIKSGKIIFKVYTGSIEDILFSNNSMIEKVKTGESFSLPFGQGDLLNLRDLEQGTENINRLKSQQVKVKIRPGKEAGGSIVVLNRTQDKNKALRGGVTASNAGNRSVSKTQASAYITAENLIGINGILNISANSNLEKISSNNFSQSLSTRYNVPIGYTKLDISHSYNRFSQVVSGTTARFISSGSSHSSNLGISHIIHRNASSKTALNAGISLRNSRSYLDNVELVVQRRNTVNVNAGLSFEKAFKQGRFLELGLSVQQGVDWFGAEDDLIEAGQGGATLRPTIFKANAGFKQSALLPGWDYSGQLNIQTTDDRILNHDKFSIGSRYTVRGFDGESVLLAESGLYLRNELQTRLESLAGSNLYLALDFGAVDGPSTELLAGETLAGAAIGLRANWQGINIDASLGTPVSKPDSFESASLTPYISVFYEF